MVNGRTVKSDEMSRRMIGKTGVFYPEWFWEQGFRFADLLVLVKKGQTERVGKEVYKKFNNVLFTSWRINTVANLVVQTYYQNSLELRDLIEGISKIEDVERVEFSEYVNILGRRSYEEVEKNIAQVTSE
ncbi:hypothetical protein [Candidatus Nitrososphaera sp. FF02]|uniref:hypothetical protein n=1 Tax=Candidatus Nitrososphaera sp. FF02 TaxID=3398226 RepID=UPI0039E9711A